MARRARWIRLGCVDAQPLRAACNGLAVTQSRDAAPIVLWACAKTSREDLGPASERQYQFVVIAPKRMAPGCAARWVSWALSPVVAVYRDVGLRAYVDDADICLHGRKIGSGCAETVGECIVIAASFDSAVSLPETADSAPEFHTWLRECLGLAMTQWGGERGAPSERTFEAALRVRIEAQHGWQFENSWPDACERRAIDAARVCVCEIAAGLEFRASGVAQSQADIAE